MAQGLGDAAKKEQVRRKDTQQKGTKAKTYTEDQLKELPPIANEKDSGAAAKGSTGSVAPAVGSGGGEEARRAQDEAYWRSRVANAQARLEGVREEHQRLSALVLVPGYVYVDQNGRTVIHSVEQLQGMTARAKADLDGAQKALDDLLEEARRANVPPGWLR
jgi:hypothetical protein